MITTKDSITAGINKKSDIRCANCFARAYKHLFEKYDLCDTKKEKFLDVFTEKISELSYSSAPIVQRDLMQEFIKITGIDDAFKDEKRESNIKAMKIYDKWQPEVLRMHDAFQATLRLAIAGNVMDYGAADFFDIDSVVAEVLQSDLEIDHSKLLSERIDKANKILYLGDNAGEIVFDRLFIESNLGDKTTYVVRSAPILNDVTFRDAEETGIERCADVISSGCSAPSTILSECSNEFLKHYETADLIISKGQGNLEGLLNKKDDRIFFLLMVKCDVIANLLNVPKGSFIVKHGGLDFEK